MSLPRYLEYKCSGVPWLGDNPKHWAVHQTKRHFVRRKELNTGMVCENRLALTMNGVVPRSLDDLDGLQSSDYEGYQLFNEGDLAFKLIDLQNIKTSRVGLVPKRGIMSPAYIRLLPQKTTHSRFAYWYFMALYWTQVFNSLGGGVRQTLGPEELLTLEYPVPPLSEQVAISTFLDRENAKIDALTAEQEKLIALLAEKRKAIITHAVTCGLKADAPMKDSGVAWLGKVPAIWDVTPLKYLVQLKSGGTPSKDNPDYWDGNIPWASAKDLKVEHLASTTNCITNAAIESGAASLVDAGVILVVVRGMILARTFPVVETLVPMAINQDLKALIPLERMTCSYLAWLLRGSADESLLRLDEAGHGTKALRMEAWTSMQLPVPPIAEQVAIADFLFRETTKLDALSAEAERTIRLLKERRSTIIAAAVTGQIDVRGTVVAPTEEMETIAA